MRKRKKKVFGCYYFKGLCINKVIDRMNDSFIILENVGLRDYKSYKTVDKDDRYNQIKYWHSFSTISILIPVFKIGFNPKLL